MTTHTSMKPAREKQRESRAQARSGDAATPLREEAALAAARQTLDAALAAIDQAERDATALEDQVRATEAAALQGQTDAASRLPDLRRDRLDATLRIGDLRAVLPGVEQEVLKAEAALQAAHIETCRLEWNALARCRAELLVSVEGAVEALLEALNAARANEDAQRALSARLGIAHPYGRNNPQRMLSWWVYSRLTTTLPAPPPRPLPDDLPPFQGELAASDVSAQPLDGEDVALMQGAGPVTWWLYNGSQGGNAKTFPGVPHRSMKQTVPSPWTAAELAIAQRARDFEQVAVLVQEPVWPKR